MNKKKKNISTKKSTRAFCLLLDENLPIDPYNVTGGDGSVTPSGEYALTRNL